MANKPATGRKRFMKLASMTASVAGNYAKTRIKSAFLSQEKAALELARLHGLNGDRIAATLGELKGAVMKVGQMASITSDLLPEELGQALRSLQREAPPMDFSVISSQIESELGAPPAALFSRFDREPYAAASIGQVHRACTDDGREVVVKVQYPGVDDAVDSDLNHLKIAFLASGIIKIKRKVVNEIIVELKSRLREELDYCNEADNVRFFHEHYKNHSQVIIPSVVGERSSQRILTLSYEPGDSLMDLRALNYDEETLNQIGYNIFSVFANQLFELQVLHADPNPANFGFRRDGTIVLYDFGCVKKLDPNIIDAYKLTIRSALTENYGAVEDGLIRLGARNLDGPPVAEGLYKMWRDILAKPFLADTFDYGHSSVHLDVIKHSPAFIAKHAASFQPSRDLVFIDRVVAGHYGNLVKIGCRGEYRALLEPYIEKTAA